MPTDNDAPPPKFRVWVTVDGLDTEQWDADVAEDPGWGEPSYYDIEDRIASPACFTTDNEDAARFVVAALRGMAGHIGPIVAKATDMADGRCKACPFGTAKTTKEPDND